MKLIFEKEKKKKKEKERKKVLHKNWKSSAYFRIDENDFETDL